VAASLNPRKVAATLSAKAKGLRSTPEIEPDTISKAIPPTRVNLAGGGSYTVPGKAAVPNPKAGKPTGQMVPGTLRKGATAVTAKAGQVVKHPFKSVAQAAGKVGDAYRGYKGIASRLGKAFAHPVMRDKEGKVKTKGGRPQRDTSKRTLKMKTANALGAVIAPFETNLRDFMTTGGTPTTAAQRGGGKGRKRRGAAPDAATREEPQSASSDTGAR